MIFHVMRKIDLLKAMRTFVMVANKQSFSAASRELNLVTSAVSRQVADIEKHFACQLLYRTTRAMHLTAEGEYYIERFKIVIAQMDELEDMAHERQQKIGGHISISAPSGSTSLGFMQSTSDFIKQHPDVRVSWMFVNRFVNMIEEGVDLAIRVGELPDSSLVARQYRTMKVHFVASPEYLQGHGTPMHPKELNQHQCILDTSNRQPGRWRYLERGNEKKAEQHMAVQAFAAANDGVIVARLAADGHGIAQLPTFLMQDYLSSGQLVPILQDYEFTSAPISLVYPANRMMNPALRALINHILEYKSGSKLKGV